MRALIVEDDLTMRALLRHILEKRGHEVADTHDGETGLAMHGRAPFALFLVDLSLPGMDGLSFVHELRTNHKEGPRGAPFVMVISGRDHPDDLLKALDAGADDYLPKPAQAGWINSRLAIAERRMVERAARSAAEQELKRIQARMLLSDRLVSVGTIAAGVAHEINNPLAYVAANLHYLAGRLPEIGDVRLRQDFAQLISEAREGAERVRHIVRELKTLSRADEQKLVVLEIPNVLRSAINVAHNEIRHRARLAQDYEPVPPVLGNEARLGQVFLNLLINAAHAIPEGNASQNEIRVHIATDATGNAVVRVRDTGSGIAPEHLGRVFDPFFTTKAVGQGTGLGLSIAHTIVSEIGGRIEVESELGRGTTLTVVLPPAAEGPRGPAVSKGTPVPPERRRKILIADDEPMVARSLKRLLQRHEVTVVESGAQALAACLKETFDLVFCDLMMPEMTGIDVYEAIQRERPGYERRFVFMTGGVFTARAQAFLEKIENPTIDKPFDLARVRQLVETEFA